jgi:hypothetical protein
MSVIRYEEARGSGPRAARQAAGAEILHPQKVRVQDDNVHVVKTRVEGDAADGLRKPPYETRLALQGRTPENRPDRNPEQSGPGNVFWPEWTSVAR